MMSAVNDIHWDEPGRLDTLLTKIDPAIALLLNKALTGGELDFDEGLALARTRGNDFACGVPGLAPATISR